MRPRWARHSKDCSGRGNQHACITSKSAVAPKSNSPISSYPIAALKESETVQTNVHVSLKKRQTQHKVPSLLVRGSGKAADLIADAVILKNSEADPGNVEQKQMWRSLPSSLLFRRSFSSSSCLPPGPRPYTTAILTLWEWTCVALRAFLYVCSRISLSVFQCAAEVRHR